MANETVQIFLDNISDVRAASKGAAGDTKKMHTILAEKLPAFQEMPWNTFRSTIRPVLDSWEAGYAAKADTGQIQADTRWADTVRDLEQEASQLRGELAMQADTRQILERENTTLRAELESAKADTSKILSGGQILADTVRDLEQKNAKLLEELEILKADTVRYQASQIQADTGQIQADTVRVSTSQIQAETGAEMDGQTQSDTSQILADTGRVSTSQIQTDTSQIQGRIRSDIEIPKTMEGWSLNQHKRGFWRAFRKVKGKSRCVYLGINLDIEAAREKLLVANETISGHEG